jgi:hypothetical protein
VLIIDLHGSLLEKFSPCGSPLIGVAHVRGISGLGFTVPAVSFRTDGGLLATINIAPAAHPERFLDVRV